MIFHVRVVDNPRTNHERQEATSASPVKAAAELSWLFSVNASITNPYGSVISFWTSQARRIRIMLAHAKMAHDN
jgi:hypothetical protein